MKIIIKFYKPDNSVAPLEFSHIGLKIPQGLNQVDFKSVFIEALQGKLDSYVLEDAWAEYNKV